MARNVAQKLLIPDEVVIHKILFLREKRVMVVKTLQNYMAYQPNV